MGKITKLFTSLAERYLPDAFIFALVLTLVVFFSSLVLKDSGIADTIGYWGNGFWDLMTFAMQMSLILVTGFTLARTDLVKKLLRKIALLPKNQTQAVLLVTTASIIACFINWGFGLVCSALLAVEVAKKMRKINYGLLLASAYSGFLVWHGGLSGSIPLKLTDPSPEIRQLLPEGNIPLSQSLFSEMNMVLLLTTFTVLVLINFYMAKTAEAQEEASFEVEPEEDKKALNTTPASKLENSPFFSITTGLLFLAYIGSQLSRGKEIDLNMVILIFLGLGIVLHGTPAKFLRAFNESLTGASGIILQFPFYAGIMGVMKDSGLAADLSSFFLSVGNESTFLFFSYLSAGLVNFFVPSGGGQWAIQGPIILEAALVLGVDPVKASLAIAWGDAWTNMIQPFWALPLLAAGNCSLKKMMGYSAVIFFGIGFAQALIFLLF